MGSCLRVFYIDINNIPNPYDRYVDDVYSQASDEKEADTFHSE